MNCPPFFFFLFFLRPTPFQAGRQRCRFYGRRLEEEVSGGGHWNSEPAIVVSISTSLRYDRKKKEEENVASAVVGAPATPGGLVAEDAAALKRRPIVIGWLRKRANKKKGI